MFAGLRITFYVVEKPAKTQNINQLANSLIRAPNSISGGHKFESLVWTDLVHCH
jgi:hypothetical protein